LPFTLQPVTTLTGLQFTPQPITTLIGWEDARNGCNPGRPGYSWLGTSEL
jgi:hypothetical protein